MKILVIDDDPGMVDFVCQIAQSQGHTDIDTASSGEEALTQVIRADYDLITLDIQMPGASGLEILSLIRDMCPHAVIAIVSGYIPDDISSDVAGCADVMIRKPVTLEAFSHLLDGAVRICETMAGIRLLGVGSLTIR